MEWSNCAEHVEKEERKSAALFSPLVSQYTLRTCKSPVPELLRIVFSFSKFLNSDWVRVRFENTRIYMYSDKLLDWNFFLVVYWGRVLRLPTVAPKHTKNKCKQTNEVNIPFC